MALTPEQHKIIKDNLARIDRMLLGFEQGAGLPPQGLSPQELQQAHGYATQQSEQAVQLAQAGKLRPRQGHRGLPGAGGGGSRIYGDDRNAPRPGGFTFKNPLLRQPPARQQLGGMT